MDHNMRWHSFVFKVVSQGHSHILLKPSSLTTPMVMIFLFLLQVAVVHKRYYFTTENPSKASVVLVVLYN